MSKACKKRFCPAVQREISSGECGENRGSSYQCPAECKFNPFAPENYKQVLEMDTALNSKMMNYLFGHSTDREEILRESRRVETSGGQFAVEQWFTWKFFFDKDANGLTCMERWEKAGYPGLKNDERVLMKARQTTRPALIEVQRVLDDEQVEVIDYLEADPKSFIARSFWRSPRFAG